MLLEREEYQMLEELENQEAHQKLFNTTFLGGRGGDNGWWILIDEAKIKIQLFWAFLGREAPKPIFHFTAHKF